MQNSSKIWNEIIYKTNFHVNEVYTEKQISKYTKQLQILNNIAYFYACDALRELGSFDSMNTVKSVNEILTESKIPDKYKKSLIRILNMCAEYGLLLNVNNNRYSRINIWPIDPLINNLENIQSFFYDEKQLLDFVIQHGRSLPNILRGKIHAAELLFTGGTMSVATEIYTKTPPFKYCNNIASISLEVISKYHSKNKSLRVIEIGAGTGATTDYVIKNIKDKISLYLFTDISNFFLLSARKRFINLSFMQYCLLDIETPPDICLKDSFDIVIAAHVLHATKRIDETLTNVHSLLVDSGFLILLEETSIQPFFNVTMGMQSGFDRFEDTSIRKTHPLLNSRQWKDAILKSGFQNYFDLPEIMGIRPIIIQK